MYLAFSQHLLITCHVLDIEISTRDTTVSRQILSLTLGIYNLTESGFNFFTKSRNNSGCQLCCLLKMDEKISPIQGQKIQPDDF